MIAHDTPRPCERHCRACESCPSGECETCPDRPQVTPGEPHPEEVGGDEGAH